MKKFYVGIILSAIIVGSTLLCLAQKDSKDVLKEGLLGAGAGVAGGAITGGKGLWKGALAGAGVNVVGGVLLDSITGEQVDSVQNIQTMDSQHAYAQGYRGGFNNGYKQGYTEGYQQGIRDAVSRQ
ncbi:MAG: hypothetical protein AB1755_04940 [Candidatus Omnitrophota bacterium]